jgi:CHAT domain-containing protein
MTRDEASRAFTLIMRGFEAYEARNLKLAVSAFATARESAGAAPPKLAISLTAAAKAARRDDRPALLAALTTAAALTDLPPEAPENGSPPPALVAPAPIPEPAPPEPPTAAPPPPPIAVMDITPPTPPPVPEPITPPATVQFRATVPRKSPPADPPALPFPESPASAPTNPPNAILFARTSDKRPAAGAAQDAANTQPESRATRNHVQGGSHRGTAAELTQLSIQYEKSGHAEEAWRLGQRALTIRRLQSNTTKRDMAASLAAAGAAALGMEDFATAAAQLREALETARQTGPDDAATAWLLDHLALAVAPLEGAAAARLLHDQALTLRQNLLPPAHPAIGWSQLHRAAQCLDAGELDTAETLFRAALGMFEAAGPSEQPGAAQCTEGLAVLHLRRNALEPARQLLHTALALLRDAWGPDHLLVLTYEAELAFLAFAAGEPDTARSLARAALRRTRPNRHEKLRHDLWYLLSQLAAARDEPAAAIVLGKLAVLGLHHQSGPAAGLPSLRNRLLGARDTDLYRHLAVLLAQAGRLAEAAQALAMQKEAELFAALARDAGADPRRTRMLLNPAETGWEAEGGMVMRPILDDDAAAGAISRQRRLAEMDFFESWLESAESLCRLPPPHRKAKHPGIAALGARVALLTLLPGPRSLHVLLSTTEDQIAREVNIAAPVLHRMCQDFRAAIAARRADAPELGAALYRILIAPVAETYHKLGIKTLLIGAEGWLRYLPFAALHDGETYLAETTATVLFTAAVPAFLAATPGNATMAAYGVHGVDDGLPQLVRSGLGTGMFAGRIALDAAFDRPSLAEGLSSHRLIHIASPTTLDALNPAHSALRLGDGSSLPLRLLANRPYHFRDVALVALTACETDAAGDGDGSEVEALGAMLRSCGAPAVLATLWRPQDGPAAKLLAAFYTQRRGGRMPGRALNAAQLEVLRGEDKHRHPYYWAGFIAMGGVE